MKKLSYTLFVAALLMTGASCKKSIDYTCTCRYIADPQGADAGKADRFETHRIGAYKKTDAQKECGEYDEKYNATWDGTCLID